MLIYLSQCELTIFTYSKHSFKMNLIKLLLINYYCMNIYKYKTKSKVNSFIINRYNMYNMCDVIGIKVLFNLNYFHDTFKY